METAVASLTLSRLALEAGAACVDAAVAGVVALEDDPKLPAGTGAPLRLDGSVELDAAVMSSSGQFGAVSNVSDVRNPVKLARAVADTPHRLLAGEGASRLARELGLDPYDPTTDAARERYALLLAELSQPDAGAPHPDAVPWREGSAGAPPIWKAFLPHTHAAHVLAPAEPVAPTAPTRPSPAPSSGTGGAPAAKALAPESPAVAGAPARTKAPGAVPSSAVGGDTVAVLARCPGGQFAGAISGGGPWLSLPGRVGDVPVAGAALYAGDKGVVFVSGPGERVLEQMLARAVYDQLVQSGSAAAALEWALRGRTPGELVVAILDPAGVKIAPEGGSAWAAWDPELRTSGGARP